MADQQDSMSWFRSKVMEASDAGSFMSSARKMAVSSITPGSMYLFSYDPKLKNILPVYDRYPLVFPISSQGDSFLGLNMHYLNGVQRSSLMDALKDLTNNNKYDESTRIVMSYQLLNGSSKYKYFEKALKKYLFSHVRSRFYLIPSAEWNFAMNLPLAQFVYK